MKEFFEENPELRVPTFFVWLPTFPRPQERWMLPGAIEEFAGYAQFWDDESSVSAEVKQRIVPESKDAVPWDIFILFDRAATWATAEEHVLASGYPVNGTREELFSELRQLGGSAERLPPRARIAGSPPR